MNMHSAPDFIASSFFISSHFTSKPCAIHSFTKSSTFFFSSSVSLWSQLKSNLILSGVMFDPFWCTSFPSITFNAAFNKCVAVWYLTSCSPVPASPPLNFCSLPILDFSWCSLNSLSNSVVSTFNPASLAKSWVTSGGNP